MSLRYYFYSLYSITTFSVLFLPKAHNFPAYLSWQHDFLYFLNIQHYQNCTFFLHALFVIHNIIHVTWFSQSYNQSKDTDFLCKWFSKWNMNHEIWITKYVMRTSILLDCLSYSKIFLRNLLSSVLFSSFLLCCDDSDESPTVVCKTLILAEVSLECL